MSNPIQTADELWRVLVDDAGFQPEGWDAPLAERMRTELALPNGADIVSGLRAQSTSAGDFIGAFFRAAQPYVKMWEGLLEMFEMAGATSTGDQIQIVYDFADESPVSFDLEHFRRSLRISRYAVAQFDLRDANQSTFWAATGSIGGDGASIPRGVEDWAGSFWQDQDWPQGLPMRPRFDDDRADALVAELWALLGFVLDELRSVSGNLRDLRDRASSSGRAPAGTPVGTLFYLENDMWIANTVRRAWSARPETASGWAVQLDEALALYRNTDPGLASLTDAFLEFLDLPSWSQRYELYSNWVSRVVLDGLSDMSPRIHASRDGRIRFAFSGCHLMTFDAFTPRLHLMTELRTPLEAPIGSGRKAAIQPDITLLFDPITDPAEGPIAIECKQYRKPDNKVFAHALTDYARGRPNAAAILVDHGRVNQDTVLLHVATDVVERCHVVSSLSPENAPAIAELVAIVRTQLRLQAVSGEVADIASLIVGSTEVEFELTWQTGPRDLDLHLYVEAAGGDRSHVYFQDMGHPDRSPYATLDQDHTSGGGREIVKVYRWIPGARYRLVVNRFSKESTLASSCARITARASDSELVLACPEGADEIWRVAEFLAPT